MKHLILIIYRTGLKHLKDTELHRVKARDEQIKAIEDTFDAAKRTPVHPQNPKLTVKEVLPLYPDFELWPNTYVTSFTDFIVTI